MFARVLVMVLSLTATGVALLAIRHGEHYAGYELARARLDSMEVEAVRRRLRAQIAQETSPEHVRLLAEVLGELGPAMADDRAVDARPRQKPGDVRGPTESIQRPERAASHPDAT